MSGLNETADSKLHAEMERLMNRTIVQLAKTTYEEDEQGLINLGMTPMEAEKFVRAVDRKILGAM